MPELPRIDWKNKLTPIEPFLDGTSGGLVCILGGASSGWRSFIKILRQMLQETDLILLINSEDETTRSPEMIIQAIEQELSLSPEHPAIEANLVQDIKAKGNVHTGDTYIQVDQPDPSFRLHARTAKIKTALEKLDSPRLVIIVEGCQGLPKATTNWLWSSLWDRNLSKIPHEKILMVCVCEASSGNCSWGQKRGQPEIQIELAGEYSGDDLEEAIRDLTEYFHKPELDYDKIYTMAEGFLMGCKKQPALVYSSLSWHLFQPKMII